MGHRGEEPAQTLGHRARAARLEGAAAEQLGAATLTDKQRLYAATDAWVCTRIYERLLRTPKKTIRK